MFSATVEQHLIEALSRLGVRSDGQGQVLKIEQPWSSIGRFTKEMAMQVARPVRAALKGAVRITKRELEICVRDILGVWNTSKVLFLKDGRWRFHLSRLRVLKKGKRAGGKPTHLNQPALAGVGR